jgi:hypothetical protein
VTALAAKRAVKFKRFTTISLAATASDTYYQGALVGFDTATGLLVVGQALTTFVPIGKVVEDTTLGAGGGSVLVELFREVVAMWFANSADTDEVTSTSIGGLAYVVDDQTVADNDSSNTRSVLGRVWAIDSAKGVLVEPLHTAGDATVSGLD